MTTGLDQNVFAALTPHTSIPAPTLLPDIFSEHANVGPFFKRFKRLALDGEFVQPASFVVTTGMVFHTWAIDTSLLAEPNLSVVRRMGEAHAGLRRPPFEFAAHFDKTLERKSEMLNFLECNHAVVMCDEIKLACGNKVIPFLPSFRREGGGLWKMSPISTIGYRFEEPTLCIYLTRFGVHRSDPNQLTAL